MVSGSAEGREKKLRDLLTQIFLDRFHRKPDDRLLREINDKLNGATLDHFAAVITQTLRRKDKRKEPIESGLFLNLAEEAGNAAAEIARRHPEPPPPPKASAFKGDPEDSKSYWAAIRRELKKRIAPQEYENWLVRTGQGDFADGILTVLVLNQVTIEYIEQEYSHLLPQCVHRAGFDPEVKFVFKVAEENS
jgi:hypothetical protein